MFFNRPSIVRGRGFFGKNLVPQLLNDGNEVKLFEGDLRKEQEVFQTVNLFRPQIVYHMGALVDLSRTYATAKQCIDINIKGTTVLLEALRGNPPARFIYTSTEEIYGDGPLPFSEDQLLKPPSFYAVSKVAAEQLASIYTQLSGYQLLILRIGTSYGAYQPVTRLIPQIIINALQNKDILLNSGKKKRDYVYIADVVEALVRALSHPVDSQINVCNIGGGRQYALKTLVKYVIDITRSTSKVLYGVYPDRILEADEWLLSNANAEKVLGWIPHTSLEEGLRKTIDFYINAPSIINPKTSEV